ncbi:hypothetical protein [Erythrobacter sp. R86502]|uniref:hypothetical protein n=1 Tax=Erythrobacter sp. R86502 TaxID=3093846 RepID=UPI0036D2716B
MIKNILGAVIGAKVAGNSPKVDNAAGAATGAIAATAIPFIISRLSLPAMVAVGAGGYFLKRHRDKQAAANPVIASTSATPSSATVSKNI